MAKPPTDPNDLPRGGRLTDTPAPRPPAEAATPSDSDWLAEIPELPPPESIRLPVIPSGTDLDFDLGPAGDDGDDLFLGPDPEQSRTTSEDSDDGHSSIFTTGPHGSPDFNDLLLDGSVDRNFPDPDRAAGPDRSLPRTDNLGSDLFLNLGELDIEPEGDGPPATTPIPLLDPAADLNDLVDELHLPYDRGDGGDTDGGRDFSEPRQGESNSDLLLDLLDDESGNMYSGVDLLNPEGQPAARSPGRVPPPDSSIFEGRDPDSSPPNLDRIPPLRTTTVTAEVRRSVGPKSDEDSSVIRRFGPGPEGEPGSGAGSGAGSSVEFGSPRRHGKIVTLGTGQTGPTSDANTNIDWSIPTDLPVPLDVPNFGGATGGDDGSDDADFSLFEEESTAAGRMAPSSGIFDVDELKEPPLGSLSKSVRRSQAQATNPTYPPPARDGRKAAAKPAPARPGSRGVGWVAGGLIGVMTGIAGCSALYLSGLVPAGAPAAAPPPPPVAAVAPAPAAPDLAEARRLLLVGSPERALPGFEAAGELTDPADRAGRGLARWQVRVREMAETGKAFDPADKFLAPALDDLKFAADNAADVTTDAGRRAVVQAALTLGLTEELTGDPTAAAARYDAAATKFPSARMLFRSAADRVRAMTSAGKVSLAPRPADQLAAAAALTLVLIQPADGAGGPGMDEPGLLFWEAVGHAAHDDYPAALTALRGARQRHEARRLEFAGRGPNPLTDPLGQIFLKCCDELAAGWETRRQFYADPVAGPAFAESGVAGALKALAAATKPDPKAAQQLAAAAAEVKALGGKLADVQADATTMRDKAAAAEAAAKAAAAKLATAEGESKALADFMTRAVEAAKTAKLVPADANAEAAMTALPGAVKKLAAAAEGADASKAAAALAAEAKKLAVAQAQTKAAQAEVARATEAARAAQAAAEKLRTEAVAAQTKVVADAQAVNDAKLAALQAEFARKEAALQRQVADARAGVAVPLRTDERLAQQEAANLYGRGHDLYFREQYADAEALLARATASDPTDARYWYFLALARFGQGNADAAAEAFKKGAAEEARSHPPRRDINAALEKVQGAARRELQRYRQ
jgi:hypothetical protein